MYGASVQSSWVLYSKWSRISSRSYIMFLIEIRDHLKLLYVPDSLHINSASMPFRISLVEVNQLVFFVKKNTENYRSYCTEHLKHSEIFANLSVGSCIRLVQEFVKEISQTSTVQIARYLHLKFFLDLTIRLDYVFLNLLNLKKFHCISWFSNCFTLKN